MKAYPLTAYEILWLRTNKRSAEPGRSKIEKLPDITTAEIDDKSKFDLFVPIVTTLQVLLQVVWGAIQIIVRAAKGLAVSQLEVGVAAFSACAIFTFLVLLYKPKGVALPARVIRCEPGSMEEVRRQQFVRKLRGYISPWYSGSLDVLVLRIPNDTSHDNPKGPPTYWSLAGVGGITLGGMIFGGIHAAGWHLTFPTHFERTLWRISGVFLIVSLLLFFVVSAIGISDFADCGDSVESTNLAKFLNLVIGVLYVLARLFLVVEYVRTLLFLPPEAYVSTWAGTIPHVQ